MSSLSLKACILIFFIVFFNNVMGAPKTSRVNIKIITDESDVVLTILTKRKANQNPSEADWERLFATEGYVRLKKREQAMKRPFEEADFKSFVLSDGLLAKVDSLTATLQAWKSIDVNAVAQKPLEYLPQDARINAKIYPVIKPRENSFVFDVKTDPAIFLYLDPNVSKQKFENTLAHELHHIGYGTACPKGQASEQIKQKPLNVQTVIHYLGAFGEGFAMLAAAGGPDIHPHAVSDKNDRERWDRDVANFNEDLKKVEKFFLDVLANRLSEEEISKTVSSFFGVQGPWYTVGWKMCVLIEKTFGRAALIDAMCDQRKLLPLYNRAATKYQPKSDSRLALWPDELISPITSVP
jgi:Putative zinc dependent peptidase (DUF5700)